MSDLTPMASHVEQVTTTGTYAGAAATATGVLFQFLTENQHALTMLVIIITGLCTVFSAVYGAYHKHQVRKIAVAQGLRHFRERAEDGE